MPTADEALREQTRGAVEDVDGPDGHAPGDTPPDTLGFSLEQTEVAHATMTEQDPLEGAL